MDTSYPAVDPRTLVPDPGHLGDPPLKRTAEVLAQGVRDGLHAGAQIRVTLGGEQVASFALGHARSGVPMDVSTPLPLLCCVKPLLAVAFGQLWERGLVSPQTRVAEVIPEFSARGKERIRFAHLLTHTSGLWPDPVYRSWDASRADNFTRITQAPLGDDARPGEQAYYSQFSAWFLLAEAIERLTGRPYQDHVTGEILEPLGMADTALRLGPEPEQRDRAGLFWTVETGEPRLLSYLVRPDAHTMYQPGVAGLGTARDLAALYGSLLPTSTVRVLSPQTAQALTARHRVGYYDVHHGSFLGWGLGLPVDGWYWGDSCSSGTFGHVGMNTSLAIADPEYDLAVAVIVNGMTGTVPGVTRNRAIVHAVYDDLGLRGTRPRCPEVTEVRPEVEPTWTAAALRECRFWRLQLDDRP
jgi:CubicO group peptidase (beta-lactamase class C family)